MTICPGDFKLSLPGEWYPARLIGTELHVQTICEAHHWRDFVTGRSDPGLVAVHAHHDCHRDRRSRARCFSHRSAWASTKNIFSSINSAAWRCPRHTICPRIFWRIRSSTSHGWENSCARHRWMRFRALEHPAGWYERHRGVGYNRDNQRKL